MIKISKMKNWYGIKELLHAERLDGNSIIYSPNGVMKTSFADGMRDILKNKNPRDVFNDLDSIYEIDCNRVPITEASDPKDLKAIIFSGLDIETDIYTDPRISKLLISLPLKKKYDLELKKSEGVKKRIKEIISKEIAKDSKYSENTVNQFLQASTSLSEVDSLLRFIDSIGNDILSHDISNIKFNDLFGEKVISVIEDANFVQKCNVYNKLVSKKFDENFTAEFSFDSLKTIKEQLVKTHFFGAGHSINLLEKKYSEKELNDYIDKVTSEVFGSEEVKAAFDSAKAVLEKKANASVKKVIDANAWLIPALANASKLKSQFINTNAQSFVLELNDLKKELLDIKINIQEIVDEALLEQTKWDIVLKTYNQRFANKNYDITIENTHEAVLDLKIPTIMKKLKSNNKIITADIHQRFSSGEKRAIYILSLLYEIELAKIEPEKFTLILDDVVDSFDYKNKYSMIEYLKELSEDEQIQLIILTHNFDFYRSCRISLKNMNSKLLAYETANGVELIDARSKEFEDFSFIHNWKSQGKVKSVISLLPFLRNIYEIKDGSKCSKYKLLCDFLHYKECTPSLKLNSLDTIFFEFGVLKPENYASKNYFELLVDEVNVLVQNQINEDKLIDKILLGIFVRLATDKVMLDRYISTYSVPPTITTHNWTHGLYSIVFRNMTPEERELYNYAITIAPAFLHVNGFMYEPLVDVGTEKIVEVVNKLKTYLNL